MLGYVIVLIYLVEDLPSDIPFYGYFLLFVILERHSLEVRQLLRCLVVSLSSLQTLISLHIVLHKNLLVLLLFDTGVLSQLTVLDK